MCGTKETEWWRPSVGYDGKPSPDEVARALTPRLKRAPLRDATLGEIRCALLTGQTVLPIETHQSGNLNKSNWKSQRLFFLDFDKDYSPSEFENDCARYGIFPALAYTTFSHTEEQPRFRAVFVNEYVITDSRLRRLTVQLLRRLYPKSDTKVFNENRFFYGGKTELSYRPDKEIHPISLLNIFYRELCGKAANGGAERIRSLARDTGIELDSRPLRLRVQQLDFDPYHESRGTRYPITPDKSVEICKAINKVYTPAENHGVTPGYLISFTGGLHDRNPNATVTTTRENNGRKHAYPSPVESELPTLTERDKALLMERCRLIGDFVSGKRKVDHPERLLLISNLRWRRGGAAWYRQGTPTRSEYQPDELEGDAKRYNFQPNGCARCPYFDECEHRRTNLLQLLPLKGHEIRRIAVPRPYVSVPEARERLASTLRDLYATNDTKVYVIAADCGIGKSEALLTLPLTNTFVGFPTHRLKYEMFQRARKKGWQPYLWRARPDLPEPYEELARRYERVGGISMADSIVQWMPEFPDTIKTECDAWLNCLREVNNQSLIFGTHEKVHFQQELCTMSERNPEGQITTEVRGRILLVGIDRPEKRNGFTPKMFDALSAAYTRLDDEPDLWVGVVFAHGDHMTAGLELPKFVEAMQSGSDPFDHGGNVDPFGLKRKCRKPLVCAMQGICFTVAIELALACDIVIAASDCRFSQLEAKRGIMPFGGATFRLVQRCGWGNAQYHLLRAGEFGAQEAHRIGLVQEVVEPGEQLDRALAIAKEIAANAPLAIQASKASSMTYVEQGEAACIGGFTETIQRLSATADAAEGVMAFVERRAPNFRGE